MEDVVLVPQTGTAVEVKFDDTAIADFFDEQVELGRWPEEFGRIWIHTHPASSAQPSSTDEETFERVFGSTDWAVMFILARGGQTYARLRYHTGPGCEVTLEVEVDYSQAFGATDHQAWQDEYDRCVEEIVPMVKKGPAFGSASWDRRRLDPWPSEDETSLEWPNDSTMDDHYDCYCDQYYNAWLNYAQPEDFPQEVFWEVPQEVSDEYCY